MIDKISSQSEFVDDAGCSLIAVPKVQSPLSLTMAMTGPGIVVNFQGS